MNNSQLISGSLAVFYPCRVKETTRIKRVLALWKRKRKRQLRKLRNACLPLTDLMDSNWVRDEMDDVLNHVFMNGNEYAPYALRCIENEYRESREGKQHSKETNVVISRFHMDVPIKPDSIGKGISVDGLLIFSLNLDNMVGSFIINLNFDDLTIENVIFLKHIFYKRYIVNINPSQSDLKIQDSKFFHRMNLGQSRFNNITVPEYVISQSLQLWKYLKWDIDFRARYSLLEVDSCVCRKAAYGLLLADEGYDFVPNDVVDRCFYDSHGHSLDLSTRKNYKYFVFGQNGIIINSGDKLWDDALRRTANYFFGMGYCQTYHHSYNPPELRTEIAGVGKGRFKTFLKAVELHYLVNVATTNEIEVRQQSHVNPFVFLKRAYRLWEIIYELDINPYHRDDVIIERFGISKKIEELKEEYKSILNLTIGYSTVFIAICTLIFTIAQLCR